MNASTRLRLWKESRALLPLWGIVMGWVIVPPLLGLAHALNYSLAGFIFGCAVLGPAVVGHEFEHRTAIFLVSQPVSRRRLWLEKLLVLGMALLALSATMLAVTARSPEFWEVASRKSTEALGLWLFVLMPIVGFCTGPALTLLARSTLGGATLTFLCPWILMMSGFLLIPEAMAGNNPWAELNLLKWLHATLSLYSAGAFLYGCRCFQRFEDVNPLVKEFDAPESFNSLFAWLANGLVPGRASPAARLLRKELRLQLPAFFVTLFLVALWLAFIALWRIHPVVGPEVMIVPAILHVLIVPILSGVVSTAEERRLGVHEMQLTLPVSARQQWLIKVITALSVNLALGILPPCALVQVSSWLAGDPQLVADIPDSVPHFLVINLIIFGAAAFASSVSANSIRALTGAFVLLLAGGVVLNLAEYPARTLWQAYHGGLTWESEGVGVGWGSFLFERLTLGWICLAAWLYWLGLAGFRRSLESSWLPVRRMLLFFAVVGILVFAAITR